MAPSFPSSQASEPVAGPPSGGWEEKLLQVGLGGEALGAVRMPPALMGLSDHSQWSWPLGPGMVMPMKLLPPLYKGGSQMRCHLRARGLESPERSLCILCPHSHAFCVVAFCGGDGLLVAICSLLCL